MTQTLIQSSLGNARLAFFSVVLPHKGVKMRALGEIGLNLVSINSIILTSIEMGLCWCEINLP